MTDAWGYVRLSQQGREGGLEEQKDAIRTYARKNGLNLQTTRNDGEKTSGFDDGRDEYQLLREKIRNDEIGAVVTRDRARLSRDFDDRLELLTELRANGVEWHVVEAGGQLGVQDVQTAGVECLHAMMDHIKKKIEIERARDAIQERIANGYWQGRAPIGLEFDDAGEFLVPDEDFDLVMEALDRLDAGQPYAEIADALGIAVGTVTNINERGRRFYEQRRKQEV